MDKDEFQQLAEKISNGMTTEKEVALYNYYYNQFQEDTSWDESVLGEKLEMEQELHERITKDLPGYGAKIKKFPYIKIAVAATVLIVASVLLLIRNQQSQSSQPVYAEENQLQQDVAPGTNRAVLTLSDGTVLNLDESQSGVLANQGDVQIQKMEKGQIVYTSIGQHRDDESVFNTITIPRGGQYQLILPDGTKVWLNSSSSLRFPVSFVNNSRVVELEGEAYFEVSALYNPKNKAQKRPFLVKTAAQQIEVLGTHFNVNAYANEDVLKTTLIEGSVKISSVETGENKILQPGQQAQLTKKGHIRLTEDIDADEATAWKNGMFYFNNTDLPTIMRQLSRWYDVEIDIKDIPQKRFNGVLSRDVKLSQVLQMMEKTSGLKFKIVERRISMLK